MQDIGRATILQIGIFLDFLYQETFYSKYLVFKWSEQIYADLIQILQNSYVQDGLN